MLNIEALKVMKESSETTKDTKALGEYKEGARKSMYKQVGKRMMEVLAMRMPATPGSANEVRTQKEGLQSLLAEIEGIKDEQSRVIAESKRLLAMAARVQDLPN